MPSAGSDLITKWATVPSTSEPLRLTVMAVSSLPRALVASVSGASFTGVTVISSVVLLPVLVT
ncbi:hypothetical protein D3C81_2257280 [compost metagenome]